MLIIKSRKSNAIQSFFNCQILWDSNFLKHLKTNFIDHEKEQKAALNYWASYICLKLRSQKSFSNLNRLYQTKIFFFFYFWNTLYNISKAVSLFYTRDTNNIWICFSKIKYVWNFSKVKYVWNLFLKVKYTFVIKKQLVVLRLKPSPETEYIIGIIVIG